MEKGTLTQNGVHLEDHEYETVKYLLQNGYDVELIPPAQIRGLRMPDIIMQGVPWEIKAPLGSGKSTIKHTVQNASHQSTSIIIDLRRCKISDEKAVNEIKRYYDKSKRIRRLMIIMKNSELLDLSKK